MDRRRELYPRRLSVRPSLGRSLTHSHTDQM